MNFIKMHGLGNDFLIFDARENKFTLTQKQIKLVCDRKFGIGCDQMIVIDSSEGADIFMQIFNSDGNEVGACGNASRCVAWLIGTSTGKAKVQIQTRDRILQCILESDSVVSVNMGAPDFKTFSVSSQANYDVLNDDVRQLLLRAYTNTIDNQDTEMDEYNDQLYLLALGACENNIGFCNLGNPHCTLFFKKEQVLMNPEEAKSANNFASQQEYEDYYNNYKKFSFIRDFSPSTIAEIGSFLENFELYFPKKINVGFAHLLDRSNIELRVWERGAGETLSCGTGACAAVVNGIRLGYLATEVQVSTPGSLLHHKNPNSRLKISWSGGKQDEIIMQGEVELIGIVEVDKNFVNF